jgi:ribosomal protein S6
MKKNAPIKRIRDISRSEEDMALLAKAATRAAYKKAIRERNVVLISDNGSIFKTLPNGEREFVKKIRRAKEMTKGETIEIK